LSSFNLLLSFLFYVTKFFKLFSSPYLILIILYFIPPSQPTHNSLLILLLLKYLSCYLLHPLHPPSPSFVFVFWSLFLFLFSPLHIIRLLSFPLMSSHCSSISYSYHIYLLVGPLFYSFPPSPHPCHFHSNTSPPRKSHGRPRHRWENNNKLRLQNRSERDGLDSLGSDLRLMACACGHFLVP